MVSRFVYIYLRGFFLDFTTYDQFVTRYTISFTLTVTPFSLKIQVRYSATLYL